MSLGCDKNRVDGEVMVGTLRLAGYDVVNNPEAAVAIIINTCGFIRDAVQESLDMVFQLAAHKRDGNCKALIIVGCMAQRYKNEIKETIPEADAIIGVGEYDKIADVVASLIGPATSGNGFETYDEASHDRSTALPSAGARLSARTDAEASHIAYVKIAEGCDNHCAYCTIPQIRGGYRSRVMEEIVEECRVLADAGAKEIVLVAQDTALYGTDIYGEKKLPALLREIAEKSGAEWIRLMYAYPEHITTELIDTMAEIPQICKYIDMPIQHSEDSVLSRMGRAGGKQALKEIIQTLREKVAGITIRTTLMVGFPSETVEDFRNLYRFAREMKFDRLGAFPYSREEGTAAATMPQQVKDEVKQLRLSRIMALQQKIHFAKQRALVGQTLSVMVDSQHEGEYTGRTQGDAYEVDAVVNFTSPEKLKQGEIRKVKIIAADDYDLKGESL